jgi:voltage-gated potassium channel
VPLAVVSALIGLMYLAPFLTKMLGLNFVAKLVTDADTGIVGLSLLGISRSSIGALLLVMSLGLLLRSRLAWLTNIMMLFAALLFHFNAETLAVPWWRIIIDSILLLLLVMYYRRFDRENMTLGILFALSSLIVFMGYAVFGSYHLGDQFSPPITDLATALYFIVVTVTSVGYGDITPVTMEARLFLVSVIILGITVIGAAVGTTLIPAFMNRIENITSRRKTIMKRSNHYIIVGHSSLASNTYHELTERGEQVTVILLSVPEHTKIDEMDIVLGDGSDVDVLKKAGGEEAKAILALLNDDSENAFVILAAKELKGGVKTVAAVNDVNNMKRIRRVHPTMIIAPQVLGGELLTMALTGEKIDSSTVIQRLLGQGELLSEKNHYKTLPLNKRSNSNSRERIVLLTRFIGQLGRDRIKGFLADCEFIEDEWMSRLLEQKILFTIRIGNTSYTESAQSERRLVE